MSRTRVAVRLCPNGANGANLHLLVCVCGLRCASAGDSLTRLELFAVPVRLDHVYYHL